MKCRCPYCQAVAEWERGSVCPACGKGALPPGFYAQAKRASARASSRAEARSWLGTTTPWFASGGMWRVFRPQSVYGRVTLWIGFICILGAVLYGPRQTPLATPEVIALTCDNLAVLRTALAQFEADCGRLPATAEGLAALIVNPGAPGWHGPYLRNLRPDPWGHPFLYRASPAGVQLLSVGPDGLEGSADDIDATRGARGTPPSLTEVSIGTEAQDVTTPRADGK